MRYSVQFDEISAFGNKAGKCTRCGKRRKRRQKFYQTYNPYNRTVDGTKKTRAEISAEVCKAARDWEQTPFICASCAEPGE